MTFIIICCCAVWEHSTCEHVLYCYEVYILAMSKRNVNDTISVVRLIILCQTLDTLTASDHQNMCAVVPVFNLCIFLFAIMLMCPPPSLIAATMPLHNRCVMAEQHQRNCPSLCVHFQQQAFNASSAIHHMKKLQSSYSEPSPSPLSLPNIIIQGSQNDLEAPGPRHDDAQALDPNGNRVSNHLSCSSPEARRSLCPPLRGSHSKPDYAHALKEPREVHSFHSESDTPFRPSKRWEELPCSSTSPLTWKSQCNMSAEVFVNCLWSRMES